MYFPGHAGARTVSAMAYISLSYSDLLSISICSIRRTAVLPRTLPLGRAGASLSGAILDPEQLLREARRLRDARAPQMATDPAAQPRLKSSVGNPSSHAPAGPRTPRMSGSILDFDDPDSATGQGSKLSAPPC